MKSVAITPPLSAPTTQMLRSSLGSRKLIHDAILMIIPLWDCVHFLHNMIGDITKLEQFKKVCSLRSLSFLNRVLIHVSQAVAVVKKIIAHFSKSNKATHLIHAALIALGGVAHELQKPGKTRFGSMFSTFVSLEPYLDIIQTLVRDKKIKFKVSCPLSFSSSSSNSS